MMCVNQLLMIAGPSCVGKTTLIQRLQEGNLPFLCQKLELGDPSLWKYIKPKQLGETTELYLDHLILQYDLLGLKELDFDKGYREDETLRILESSNEITVLTLWTTFETLHSRNLSRIPKNLLGAFRFESFYNTLLYVLRKYHAIRWRRKFYKNPYNIYSLYTRWFTFCKRRKLKAHWIIDTTKRDPRIISFEQLMRDINGNVKNIQFL